MSFESLVGEFDRKLTRAGGGQSQLTRDGDDIAIFDRGPIRVALGWVAPGVRKKNWYLIMVVGPSPEYKGPIPDDTAMSAMANRVLKHAEARFPTDSVYRCDVDRQIDSDLIDFMTEAVLSTDTPSAPNPVDPPINYAEDLSKTRACWSPHILLAHRDAEEYQKRSKAKKQQVRLQSGRLVGTAPDALPVQDTAQVGDDERDRVAQLRQILTEIDPEQAISLPMHLTLYTFSLSMMLHVPSIGAALFIYNLLREDSLPFL
ncbi:hypothetical protein ACEWPM_017245 [Roseovarius sp. S4756]|uniref:hypothetical protein n=1 Tax=Roseovarius maritimus TaxID=3342637 RepID=UPI003726EC4B